MSQYMPLGDGGKYMKTLTWLRPNQTAQRQ